MNWVNHAQSSQSAQKSTPSPKIDSVLAQLLSTVTASGLSAQAAQQAGVPIQGNAITVVAEASGVAAGLITAITQIAGSNIVRSQSRNYLKLQIPLTSGPLTVLLRVASIAGIAYIRAPLAPQALVISEGVSVTGASSFHSNGLRGQGAKIAVIDLGFAGLSTAQSRGELPTSVQTFDFTGTGLQNTTSHGTAVAEIIYDMAPDAQLYLMKIADEVDLENAVDTAIQQGVRIINHSVAWFNTNFYDGTGPIDAAVQRAQAANILWVNSAGNYGQRHWQGFALDSNGNGFVEFASGREGLQLTGQAGEMVNVFLTWQDWPRTAQDYDLYLVNGSGVTVASSERLQNGSQPPTENLFFRLTSGGSYEIRVKAANVTSPRQLAIFNLGQDINPVVPQGSIVAPAESSSALAVGAVSYFNWTSGPLQPFSSQGPTTDGRTKPDLVGPDTVSTSTAGFNPFIGTSASTPHVAGAAALLLSENPTLTASGLESRLRGTAIPMGSPNQFGSGRLNLAAPVPQLADLIILNPAFFPSNPRVGDTITVTAQVRNQGSATAGPFSVELRDSFGSLTQNFSGLAAGASASINFNRQLNALSNTLTLTADPFNQVSESNENNNSVQLLVTAQSQPTLSIDVQTDRTSYRVGDEIQVQFTTNADGFVYLYDVDSQGLVTLLYPMTESANAFLRAGSYNLASLLGISRLQVTDPTGLENIHAILVSGAVNLQLNGQRNGSFTDANTFRSVLAQRIQSVNPSLSFAWDVASFQVTSSLPANQPPMARFTFSPSQPFVNDSVIFDGTSSSDPDGFITSWNWTFQGTNTVTAQGAQVTVRFASARTFRVTLTVTDNQGASSSTFQDILVQQRPSNQPPIPRFTFNPQNPTVNQLVTFDASTSSDPDGQISSYQWDFQSDGRVDQTGVIAQASFSRPGSYQVTLRVTDNGGLTNSTTQTVTVTQAPPPPPPPPPTLPTTFGFFIIGQETGKFQIVVQGDASWTNDRPFQILVRHLGTGSFTARPEAQATGNASSSSARLIDPGPDALMTGTVRDGKVTYTLQINFLGTSPRSIPPFRQSASQALEFLLELDTNGDGRRERWPNVAASVYVTDHFAGITPDTNNGVFLLLVTQGSLLPFSRDTLQMCGEFVNGTVKCTRPT